MLMVLPMVDLSLLVVMLGRAVANKQQSDQSELQSTTSPLSRFVHEREQEERMIERERIKKEGRLVCRCWKEEWERGRKERGAED